jgi:hypothetical protein
MLGKLAVPHHRTEPQRSIGKSLAAVQFFHPRQADKRRRLNQPRIEHRHQTGTARERPDVGATGQQADRFTKSFGAVQHRGSRNRAKRYDFT